MTSRRNGAKISKSKPELILLHNIFIWTLYLQYICQYKTFHMILCITYRFSHSKSFSTYLDTLYFNMIVKFKFPIQNSIHILCYTIHIFVSTLMCVSVTILLIVDVCVSITVCVSLQSYSGQAHDWRRARTVVDVRIVG